MSIYINVIHFYIFIPLYNFKNFQTHLEWILKIAGNGDIAAHNFHTLDFGEVDAAL